MLQPNNPTTPSERYNMETGELKEWLPMRNDEFSTKYGFHNALLGWADITGALRAALPPGSVTPSAAVAGFERGDGGGVRVLGEGDEVLATAKVLIGADGWFSGVRAQLLADGPPTFKDAVVWRARVPRRPEWLPNERRTQWWVPPDGMRPGALLAVLIPVPGGDLVWQCHAPLSRLQEKGISFDPVTGEAGSSHSDGGGGASASAGAGGESAKARCLKVFEGLAGIGPFMAVVAGTPESAVTEHGLYQRTPDQIPDGSWGDGMVTLAGDSAHTA
jgi:salicylate hydroxylase